MTDLEFIEVLLSQGLPVPVDLQARLLEAGVDVEKLIDNYADINPQV